MVEDATKKKIGIIALVIIGVAIFGYSQYASASHISVSMIESDLLVTDENGVSDHYIALEFNNPSLLVLTAGVTEFTVESDGESIGEGVLDTFTLTPLSKAQVGGIYYSDDNETEDTDGTNTAGEETGSNDGNSNSSSNDNDIPTIRITGQTEYDMWFASINIPFEYHPTDEQARGFIHQG